MVALNFNARFADAVKNGTKLQTVRREGKRKPIVTGTNIQLYTGQRTRNCVKLGDAVCTGTDSFSIGDDGWLFVGGRTLDQQETHDFAVRDGFDNTEEMLDFLVGYADWPFDGWVIKWELT